MAKNEKISKSNNNKDVAAKKPIKVPPAAGLGQPEFTGGVPNDFGAKVIAKNLKNAKPFDPNKHKK